MQNSLVEIIEKQSDFIIKLPGFLLSSSKFADQWFSSENHKILLLKGAFQRNKQYFVEASPVQSYDNFFTLPFNS